MPSSPKYLRASSAAPAALGNGAVALAGGTELVPLFRDGLLPSDTEIDTLVDIRDIVPRGVEVTESTVTVGAGTTLAELERADAGDVADALREACRLAASPQIRNVGTIAGNLLQHTRCWYWRLGENCWLRGGDTCPAKAGRSDEHALFGNDKCASAHPSDPAAALVALRTRVRTDRREFPLIELYRLPTDDNRSTTTLEPGELILDLRYDRPDASVYLKAMDRKRFAFPLVGVAAARYGSEVQIALAGVAPIPWPLGSLDDATPTAESAYKLRIARALVDRARAAVA